MQGVLGWQNNGGKGSSGALPLAICRGLQQDVEWVVARRMLLLSVAVATHLMINAPTIWAAASVGISAASAWPNICSGEWESTRNDHGRHCHSARTAAMLCASVLMRRLSPGRTWPW